MCIRNISHRDKLWTTISSLMFYGIYWKICNENILKIGIFNISVSTVTVFMLIPLCLQEFLDRNGVNVVLSLHTPRSSSMQLFFLFPKLKLVLRRNLKMSLWPKKSIGLHLWSSNHKKSLNAYSNDRIAGVTELCEGDNFKWLLNVLIV
jgi:hypothetical protein